MERGFDNSQEIPVYDLGVIPKVVNPLNRLLFQTPWTIRSGYLFERFTIFGNPTPLLDRAFRWLHMILHAVSDVRERERLDRAVSIAREDHAAIRHSFHCGSVPLEHWDDRRQVAEERGRCSSRVECDFTDADFGNVHLADCSTESVREKLMSKTDAEIRFSSFAYP